MRLTKLKRKNFKWSVFSEQVFTKNIIDMFTSHLILFFIKLLVQCLGTIIVHHCDFRKVLEKVALMEVSSPPVRPVHLVLPFPIAHPAYAPQFLQMYKSSCDLAPSLFCGRSMLPSNE